jgi:hypothetical protein
VSCVADLLGDPRPEIIAGTTVYACPTRPPAPPPRRLRSQRRPIAPGGADEQAWCAGRSPCDGTPDPSCPTPSAMASAPSPTCSAPTRRPPGPRTRSTARPKSSHRRRQALHLRRPHRRAAATPCLRRERQRGWWRPTSMTSTATATPRSAARLPRYVVIDLQPPTPACPDWPVASAMTCRPPEDNPCPETPAATAPPTRLRRPAPSAARPTALRLPAQRMAARHRRRQQPSHRLDGLRLQRRRRRRGHLQRRVLFPHLRRPHRRRALQGAIQSRTRIENPVVADVDNDGNAEIVFTVNNDAQFCSQGARTTASRSGATRTITGSRRAASGISKGASTTPSARSPGASASRPISSPIACRRARPMRCAARWAPRSRSRCAS